MTRVVVVLRRPLSPRECEVLAELVEAPAYKVVAAHLHVAPRTIKFHVAAIAALLPADWFPRAESKDRVVFYAQRVHVDATERAAQRGAA